MHGIVNIRKDVPDRAQAPMVLIIIAMAESKQRSDQSKSLSSCGICIAGERGVPYYVGISKIRGCSAAWGIKPHAERCWIRGLPWHDGPRWRTNVGEYPVPVVGANVDRRSGESCVVLEVVGSYDSA